MVRVNIKSSKSACLTHAYMLWRPHPDRKGYVAAKSAAPLGKLSQGRGDATLARKTDLCFVVVSGVRTAATQSLQPRACRGICCVMDV